MIVIRFSYVQASAYAVPSAWKSSSPLLHLANSTFCLRSRLNSLLMASGTDPAMPVPPDMPELFTGNTCR